MGRLRVLCLTMLSLAALADPQPTVEEIEKALAPAKRTRDLKIEEIEEPPAKAPEKPASALPAKPPVSPPPPALPSPASPPAVLPPPASPPAVLASPPSAVPVQPAPAPPAQPISLALSVQFEPNSATLSAEGRQMVDTLGKALSGKQLAKTRVMIEGHTDASGPLLANDRLSLKRAEAVRDYLILLHSLDAQRLLAAGKGSRELAYPQQPRSPLNRRVVIKVLPMEGQP